MSYFDEKGNIRVGLLETDAFELAKSFVLYYTDKRGERRLDEKKSLSSSQMRRFFGEFRQLEKRVEKEGFDAVKPLIKMVKSKASYAANRPSNKIPKNFKSFLEDNVDMIETKADFKAFILHFEAVVGFFYGIPGVRNN